MDGVLLKDYRPHYTLVTEEHLLDRPRFPAVDAHNHHGFLASAFGDQGPGAWLRGTEDVGQLVGIMDRCGIKRVANLTACFGDDLKRVIDHYEGPYPGRFYTLANVDWRRLSEPGFGEWAARQLEDGVRAGARGLKVFKGLGLYYRDASGRLLSPDDLRLDPLWARAGELGVPVHMHLADPPAFFRPLDAHNERYVQIAQRPQWHYYRLGVPSFEQLIAAGIRLIGRHPQTTFITSHMWWCGGDLRFVDEQMMGRLPNMVTDIAATIVELGRQPYSTRKFVLKYQDRILFGTDMMPSLQGYCPYFRFLETADEFFEAYPGHPLDRIYGLDLPDEVLEKLYYRNVERIVLGLA